MHPRFRYRYLELGSMVHISREAGCVCQNGLRILLLASREVVMHMDPPHIITYHIDISVNPIAIAKISVPGDFIPK